MGTAEKLCTAMGLDVRDVFTIEAGAGKLSDRTVQHHHKLIRLLLNAAKKARIIPHNVASEYMEGPKLPRSEARYLDDEQARTFLAALSMEPDIRIKVALTLALFTGARRGELCGLSWPDIDFPSRAIHIRRASQYVAGRGVIEVPTKNMHSVRTLTVTPHVLSLLSEYRRWWLEQQFMNGDRWKGEHERLFIQEDGKPVNPDTVNQWLRRFLKKNDLPPITVHSLRHTFITLQLSHGVDIRTLQARSGHAQASTLLNIYSHAIQSAQERAAQTLDAVLLPAIQMQ